MRLDGLIPEKGDDRVTLIGSIRETLSTGRLEFNA
jgi:hypothetical protein